VQVLSHVVGLGRVKLSRGAAWEELAALSRKPEVLLGCVEEETELKMKAVVDEAYRTGDTVGGVFEVVAHHVPPGLGSHITWDTRLDGRLAQAIVSIQAVKGWRSAAAEGAASLGSACRTLFITGEAARGQPAAARRRTQRQDVGAGF
jgi:chorismate synthase